MRLRFVSAALVCGLLCRSGGAAQQRDAERYRYTGSGDVRLYLGDGEQTAVLSEREGVSLVQAADEGFSRNEYDPFLRLKSRTVWRAGDSGAAAVIAVRTDYSYEGDSFRLLESQTYDAEKATVTVTSFSAGGLPAAESVYAVSPEPAEGGKPAARTGESRTLRTLTEYRYAAGTELSEKTVTDYTVNPPASYRTVYRKAGDIRGGYDYFENGVLRVSRNQQDADNYTETFFFDGGLRVESTYRGGILREELFFDGKTELRRNSF